MRSIQIGMVAIALAAISLSCGQPTAVISPRPPTTSTDCRTITHALGETEVCGQPQRVAVLGPNLLELLLVLEVQPVGFADHIAFHTQEYDNPAVQIPYLGDRLITRPVNLGLDYTPNLEALLKSKPDLILGPSFLSSEQYATFSKIAPTLLLDWFETEDNLRAIATAVGKSDQAESILIQMQQQVAEAQQQLAPVAATHPQVLMLSSTNLTEIRLFTRQENYCASLIEDLGFRLIYPPDLPPEQQQSSILISLEQLPKLNQADLAILFGADFAAVNQLTDAQNFERHQVSKLRQTWKTNAIAQSLEVSKSGRSYFFPAYLCLGLPGPIGTKLYLNELKKQLLPAK